MSSIDVLVTTLVKAFKLEPEVEKAKDLFHKVVADDLPGQVKEAIELVRGFDERLSRIEMYISGGNYPAQSDTDPANFDRENGVRRLLTDDTPQLRNGTD